MNQIITLEEIQNAKLSLQSIIGRDGSIKQDTPAALAYSELDKKLGLALEGALSALEILDRDLTLDELLYIIKVEQSFYVGPVSGITKLNKAKGRIFDIQKSASYFEALINKIVLQMTEQFPGYRTEIYILAAKSLIVILDSQFEVTNQQDLIERILASFEVTGNLNFTLFMCPPTNFEFLNTDYPEAYLRSSLEGSLPTQQIPILKTLPQLLRRIGVNPNLLALSGDDDGIYLTPLLNLPDIDSMNVLRLKPNEERDKAKRNIEFLLRRGRILPKKDDEPAFENLNVVSLGNTGYEIEEFNLESLFMQIYENPCAQIDKLTGEFVFTENDFKLETERMRELFEDYYKDIVEFIGRNPTDDELNAIVRIKFALYSIQGVLANALNPFSILIQVEKPRELRDKMLNGGLRILGLPVLPSVYI